MPHNPTRMCYEELANLLRDIANSVEQGDSFEGFLEYLMPETPDASFDAVDVRARWRVGNKDGQGGMIVIGNFANQEGEI